MEVGVEVPLEVKVREPDEVFFVVFCSLLTHVDTAVQEDGDPVSRRDDRIDVTLPILEAQKLVVVQIAPFAPVYEEDSNTCTKQLRRPLPHQVAPFVVTAVECHDDFGRLFRVCAGIDEL